MQSFMMGMMAQMTGKIFKQFLVVLSFHETY